jgi:ABC-2 type transport system permease protein
MLGLVIFYYFSEGTTQLADTLLKRSNKILRLNFPRIIVIWSSILSSMINFCASLLFFFFLVGTFFRSSYELSAQGILLFAVAIIFLSLFILGFGLFASIIQVKFRDFQQIWTSILQLILYSTPIIYPIAILPTYLQKIILLNPLTIIVDFSRNQLLGTPLTVPISYVFGLGSIIVAIDILGYYYFKTKVKRIAEQI